MADNSCSLHFALMTTTVTGSGQPVRTPPLFWGLLIVSTLAAFVPTVWTQLDIWAASQFAGAHPTIDSAGWWWVSWINDYVPAAFRVLLLMAAITLVWIRWSSRAKNWRLWLAFSLIAGILGPGAVVNHVFKDQWQRARPYQVENFGGPQQFTRAAVLTDQCDNNCSFVSGHVACGFFFATLMLVHQRRRRLWAVIGTAAGLGVGFSRMSEMAHWLSDVLWAYPITLMTSWLVWRALLRFYGSARTDNP